MSICPDASYSKYMLPYKGSLAPRVNLTENEVLIVSGYCLTPGLEIGFMSEGVGPDGDTKAQILSLGGTPKCISESNITEVIPGPGTFYAYVKAGTLGEAFLCKEKTESSGGVSLLSGISTGDTNVEIDAECLPISNTGILPSFSQLNN